MRIYIIEHRIINYNENKTMENVVVHASSSLEKAKEFCKDNLDYEKKDSRSPWWFYIYPQELDSIEILDDNVIISWDGKEIKNQPINGY